MAAAGEELTEWDSALLSELLGMQEEAVRSLPLGAARGPTGTELSTEWGSIGTT